MERIKVKPCPFCGKKPKVDSLGGWFQVYCSNAMCYIKPSGKWGVDKKVVVERWNIRNDTK